MTQWSRVEASDTIREGHGKVTELHVKQVADDDGEYLFTTWCSFTASFCGLTFTYHVAT